MLVDLIAQGNAYSSSSGEPPAYGAQEGSPTSVLQLNGSATNRTESFDLGVNNAVGDGSDSQALTQRLLVDFVLTLMKHVMHWAASERITVDPTLWSRLVDGADPDGCANGPRRLDQEVPVAETAGWFAERVKGLCNRASSVVLDGVDRTPSSWQCLIKHAQVVFKYSTVVLETALEREAQDGEEGAGAEETDTGIVDRLEETLVGLLLPAVVTGLLPFAHVPIFARRLLDVVNAVVGLLDEMCFKCPLTRLADEQYLAARNEGGEAPKTKRKPQVIYRSGGGFWQRYESVSSRRLREAWGLNVHMMDSKSMWVNVSKNLFSSGMLREATKNPIIIIPNVVCVLCKMLLLSTINNGFCAPQTSFMRGENGKLGGGGTTGRNGNGHTNPAVMEAGAGPKETPSGSCDSQKLPWLLSLAKTTALLAGEMAATVVVGDSGVSSFLEDYFRLPVYSSWLESDLFKGGCDSSYDGLMLGPLDITSQGEISDLGVPIAANTPNGGVVVTASDETRSRGKLDEFLEGVASGSGQGGLFMAWLAKALAPSNTAYRIVKHQAITGQDGRALALVERVMMAALLRHSGLDGAAALFSACLGRRGGDGDRRNRREPPGRFAALWKITAEVRISPLVFAGKLPIARAIICRRSC